MITEGKIRDAVWLMAGNKPVTNYIAEIKTVTTATGTSITYGLHPKLEYVGEKAPYNYYAPERLYSSKEELKTAVFGS